MFLEFSRLMTHLKLETWLKNFQLDLTLYKGHYEQLRTFLMSPTEVETQANSLARDLLLLSSYYFTQNFSVGSSVFFFFLHCSQFFKLL